MPIVLSLILVLASAGAARAGALDGPGALKALNCAACHGPAGQSASDTMPILAGLAPAYFTKAIEDYASGKRPSTEMEPYAKQVLELGVGDIAAYFAAQRREPTRIALDPGAVERGRAAAQPCASCHGSRGEGDPARLIPDLRGQPPGYLRSQMGLFKDDKRSPGDERLRALKALMKTIPDGTLADLAAYYSSVR
jgi:cytochrome c553